jgi:2-polyprenyl-6-methoxyphenol hydroxylase-like FAD-dependent oxidoreductase
MHPKEAIPRYEGTTQYRGVTRWSPFLSGVSMVYLGTKERGKLIIYPIRNAADAEGNQLLNWVIEVVRPASQLLRDWNRRSRVEEFIHHFENCSFDWLDIPAVLRANDAVYEYPMVDQDPLPFWTRGRITLLGDAAHPMMPRGSNGAAQAIIDAITLAQLLAERGDQVGALKGYEACRLKATADVVLANRSMAPDGIISVVEQRTNGRPFQDIEGVISSDEIKAWQDRYREIAGFAVEGMKHEDHLQ